MRDFFIDLVRRESYNIFKKAKGGIKMPKDDKVVICLGDSITEGMAMARQDAYPGVLGEHLKDQIKVLNAGVGGENSYTICSRANALPFTVTNDIVFEKGQYEFFSNYKIFSGINGEMMRYRYGVMGRDLPITNLFIDEKPYTLRFDRVGIEEEDKYVLCREDASEREVIKVGALIKYDYSRIYKECYCTVLLQGANDGDMPIDIIIDRYRKIEALNKRFIPLIPHYRGDDVAKKFREVFGKNCVDLREYCKEKVWADYNIEKDEDDIKCLKEGKLSTRFIHKAVYNDCHLNKLGYKILADLVYEKGKELGYWK